MIRARNWAARNRAAMCWVADDCDRRLNARTCFCYLWCFFVCLFWVGNSFSPFIQVYLTIPKILIFGIVNARPRLSIIDKTCNSTNDFISQKFYPAPFIGCTDQALHILPLHELFHDSKLLFVLADTWYCQCSGKICNKLYSILGLQTWICIIIYLYLFWKK